jgi:hypothetical protein
LSLARFEDSLEAPSLGEEKSHFFIALSRGNEKCSPPQAGSLLFIATGSVDMNIRFLPPAFLSASPASQGLLQAGREIFFSLHASTLKPEEPFFWFLHLKFLNSLSDTDFFNRLLSLILGQRFLFTLAMTVRGGPKRINHLLLGFVSGRQWGKSQLLQEHVVFCR